MSNPIPTTNIILPSKIFVNENFILDVQFSNTAPMSSDIGYVPAIDLIIPSTISIPSIDPPLATWNGTQWLDATNQPIMFYPGYPTCPLPTGTFNIGDKLYNIMMGYSSYGPNQPVLNNNYNTIYNYPTDIIPAMVPSFIIQSRGIFLLGSSPVVVPNGCIAGQLQTVTSNALQYDTTKTHSGIVGDKQPTGPNYPITYTLKTHIAPNQTFTNLILSDPISSNLRYIPNTVVFVSGPVLTLGTNIPGQYTVPDNVNVSNHIFNFNYMPVTGPTDITINYQVFTDYYVLETPIVTSPTSDSGLPYVLNAKDPQNSITITNTVNVSEGNQLLPNNIEQTDQFPAGPYALSKSYDNNVPMQPGDYIPYTMTVSISDYFTFNNLVITDLISAGQIFTLDPLHYPTYQPSGQAAVPFPVGNISQSTVSTGGMVPFDQYNQVIFTIPNNTTPPPYPNTYYGPIFHTATSGATNPPTYTQNPIDPAVTNVVSSPETITVKYFTIFQSTYSPYHPDINIELLDKINNSASITGNSFDIFNGLINQQNTGASAVEIQFPSISIVKSIYAYYDSNGVQKPFPVDGIINPNDILAYETITTFSFQNISSVVWQDYLPPPLVCSSQFSALSGQTITSATAHTPSTPGTIYYGPSHTATLNNGTPLNSTFSFDASSNEISLNYGSFNDIAPHKQIVLDVIYSVRIGDAAFKDGLMFTNQSVINTLDNFNIPDQKLATKQFTIAEPLVDIKKTLVTGNSQMQSLFGTYGSAFTPTFPSPFVPSSAYFNAFTPYSSNTLVGGEQLRYAMLVTNLGHYGAFSIQIDDVLSSSFVPFIFNLYVYKYKNDGTTVLLVDGVDFTENTTATDLTVTINTPLSNNGPSNLILQTNELYAVVIDAVLQNSLPNCGTITNIGKINQYYNQYNNTNNFVPTVNSPQSTNISNTLQPMLSSETFTTASSTTNTESTGFVPEEVINGIFDVTYPLDVTNNIVCTVSTNIPSAIINISAPTVSTGTTAINTTQSGNQWKHDSVIVTSGTGIISYPFQITIPQNTLPSTYVVSFNFTSGDEISSCNLNTSRNLLVVTPTISLSQCYDLVPFNEGYKITYNLTITNNGPTIAYNVTINDTLEVNGMTGVFNIESVGGPYSITSGTNPIIDIVDPNHLVSMQSVVYTIVAIASSPLTMGDIVSNNYDSTFTYLPSIDNPQIITGPSSFTSFIFDIPLRLQANVLDITYDHNVDIGDGSRDIVGAIGDIMQYTFVVGAVPNIIYNSLNLNFSLLSVPIDQLLLIPNTATVTNTVGIPSLPPLAVTISGETINIIFPVNDTNGYLITPPPSDNLQTYTIVLPVRIANNLNNQASSAFNPTITVTVYQGENPTPVIVPINPGVTNTCSGSPPDINDYDFTVVEPVVSITKVFNGYTSPSTLMYTVTLQNLAYNFNTNEWVSSAFQMIMEDDKFNDPSKFSSVMFTTLPSGWTDQSIGLVLRAVMNLSNKLIPGSTITFTFSVNYLTGAFVQPQTFVNTSFSTYKSMAAQGPFSRTGDDGPGPTLNNYYVQAQASIILSSPTIVKHLLSLPTITSGQNVQYALVVTLPEGLNNNVVVDDIFNNSALSGGYLIYNNYQIVTTAAASMGLLANDFGGTIGTNNAISDPANNEIKIGFVNVTVNNNNDITKDSFVILLNMSASTSTTRTVTNTANLSYSSQNITPTLIMPGLTLSTSNSQVNLVIPILNIAKSVDSVNTSFSAGSIIPYVIVINHTNNSSMTAYNMVLSDPITFGTVVAGSVQVTSTCGPVNFIVSNNLTINLDPLPVGCTYTIKYNVLTNQTLQSNNYPNTSTINYDNNDGTNLNPVFSSANSTASIFIGLPTYAITKTVNAGESVLKAGGSITWDITYTNTGQSQIIAPFNISETAIPSWLIYVGTGWIGTNPFIYTDNISLNPNESRSIKFIVSISNNLPSGINSYTNTVNFGPASAQSTVNVLVGDPLLIVSKELQPGSSLISGGVAIWKISYSNIGKSTAYNAKLTESLTPPWATVPSQPPWTETPPLSGIYVYNLPDILPGTSNFVYFQININSDLAPGHYSHSNTVTLSANKMNPDSSFSPLLPISASNQIQFDVSSPNLTVSKLFLAGESSLQPGGVAKWSITYANTGGSTAHNVVLTEPSIPSWATFSGPVGWVGSGLGSYKYILPDLIAGATGTVDFIININNVGPGTYNFPNIVNLDGTQTDNNNITTPLPTATSTSSIIFVVDPPRLTIEKELISGASNLAPGGIAQWKISYTNIGTTTATNVVITDQNIPSWATFPPGQPGWIVPIPPALGPYVYHDPLPLAAGETRSIFFIISIDSNLPVGLYTFQNTADLDADNFVQISDSDFITFNVGSPMVNVVKTYLPGESSLILGGNIKWQITYTNIGDSTAYNIVLTEPALPPWLIFNPQPGWVAATPPATGPYTYTDPNPLTAGQSRTITFDLEIAQILPSGSYTYPNIVTLNADKKTANGFFPLSPTTSTSTVIVNIGPSILDVSKISDKNVVTIGDIVTWSIILTNDDDETPITGAVITESTPPFVTFISASNPGWVNNMNNTYTYTVPANIPPGQTITVPFVVQITSSPPSNPYPYTNVASVSFNNGQTTTAQNTIQVNTYKSAPYVYKVVDNTNPKIGDIVTWTILYSNIGNYQTTSIVLTEPALPSWLEFVGPIDSVFVHGWTGTGPYTYTDLVPLFPQQSRIIYFKVKVIANPVPNPTNYINHVTLQMIDKFGTDQTVSSDSNFYINLSPANLTIDKTICCDANTYKLGDIIPWTITVSNIGESIATNVEVIEPALPAYLQFVGLNQWIQQPDLSYIYTISTLLPNQIIKIPFTVKVVGPFNSPVDFSYTNVATINYGEQTISASSTINIIVTNDITLVKKIVDDGLARCKKIKYQITLSNNGNTVLTGPYTLYDIFPVSLVFDPKLNPGWKYAVNNNGVYVSYLMLGNNQTLLPNNFITIDIIFTINKTNKCTIENIAQLYPIISDVKPITEPTLTAKVKSNLQCVCSSSCY